MRFITILSILTVISLVACVEEKASDTVTFILKRPSGAVFANEPIMIASTYDTTDYVGNGTTDVDGKVKFTLEQGSYSFYLSRDFAYAKNGRYLGEGCSGCEHKSQSVTLHEVTAIDHATVHSSATQPTITTETNFATSITLPGSTDFCYMGIGIGFNASYTYPAGTEISIHADNAGEPDPTPLFSSTDISHLEILTNTQATAGGMAGYVCDSMKPARTLGAGTYWIVASFTSPPTACAQDDCFSVWGTTNLASTGYAAKASSDGGSTWSNRTYIGGGETRQSMTVYLAE
jgi:hypothetical protein